MRLLLAESERATADAVYEAFLKNGYTVQIAYDGTEGMRLALNVCFDVIVLGTALPGHSGLSILRALRRQKRSTPVMLLTARADVSECVAGLDCGADDCLPKPFALEELLARVRALYRRSGGAERSGALYFADITLHAGA
ncbi:MAG TPA: response regulator, partial [Feifaniaceae bacterium]|nr:response regulator [Feifaniaceae bacterium]